ncbi:MAG: serine/threonine protein kinase [Clostridiales bacterium]|jgi:serine/threonine protein kinase|nr:serine/threonine protein kinase [Clostridiales bacterium]
MARVRTNKNICLYCFGDLDSSRCCTSCKKKSDDAPNPPHHLPQRTVLNNKYLIYKALGEGGFGITYLAWDLIAGVRVAVKEYFPSGYVNRVPKSNQVIINSQQNKAASNRGLKRFIEEAKMLAKIKNMPGIVSVRDFFSANGTAYIVMEFLDGISFKKYVQRKGGKISTDEVLGILRPVMESLISVHNLGLIHRDISPDNILITKQNEVKLIDFGAAKQSNLDGKSLSIVLKQGFAPEEQYRTHGEQGPWTDIYALGVTIYYAITGGLPPESIQRMYKDTIIKPSEKGAAITPQQESALMKSLAVYAKNRYQNVQQMIAGLYGVRAARAAATPPPPQSDAVTKPLADNAARRDLPNTVSRPLDNAARRTADAGKNSANTVSRPLADNAARRTTDAGKNSANTVSRPLADNAARRNLPDTAARKTAEPPVRDAVESKPEPPQKTVTMTRSPDERRGIMSLFRRRK